MKHFNNSFTFVFEIIDMKKIQIQILEDHCYKNNTTIHTYNVNVREKIVGRKTLIFFYIYCFNELCVFWCDTASHKLLCFFFIFTIINSENLF